MKIFTLLIVGIFIWFVVLIYYSNQNRILENDLYKCEQDWSRKYAELRTQNKILDFKYESLKFECDQGKG